MVKWKRTKIYAYILELERHRFRGRDVLLTDPKVVSHISKSWIKSRVRFLNDHLSMFELMLQSSGLSRVKNDSPIHEIFVMTLQF